MKKIYLFFLLTYLITILYPNCSYGQKGSIEGVITDKSNNEALIGTAVVIDGTTIGTLTDIEGHFKLPNLNPGSYKLKVTYVSYNTVEIDNVMVQAGQITSLKVELESNLVSLGDINITAARRTNTEISMITDIKSNVSVSTGISGQQISKTLDKDASEVVKRVPGITIVDDRFLIVRGLSQRYNTVWLNNSATPSAEADVKAFSFDIIPSSMIENIMIFKSPAAELPADFAGGFVKISTRNMPDENSTLIQYGTGINQGTTFKDFYKYDGSTTDFLGFDKGTRALPADMPSHLNLYESATNPVVRENITTLGRELLKNWTNERSAAFPDQKFLLSVNRKFKLGRNDAGNTTALTYSLSNNSDNINIDDYSIWDFGNNKSSYLNEFNDLAYTRSARVSLMHNWAFILGNKSKIEFRNLFNQAGYTRTTMRTGREWYNDGRYIRSEDMRYLSRTIYSGQIAGNHTLGKTGNLFLDWIAGYSYSLKNEPDTKRYRYIQNPQNPSQYMLLFSDQADLSSVSRMWIRLNENAESASMNLNYKMNISGFRPDIKAGFYFENKEREFIARNFGYAKASSESTFDRTSLPVDQIFTDANINLTNGIKLMEVTNLSDSYTASNLQVAGYLSVRFPVISKLNLYTGIRIEKNRQTLSSYKQGSTIKVDVDRDTINIFPSANLTYNFNEKNLLRLAYGITVNRPEFREIAPFYYVDFEMNAGIYGAPDIRQAYIHSFDLRYEAYPSPGQTFNIGAFFKHFIDPIEQVILGNSPTQYSFENVKSAYSAGIEAEARKSLGFIKGLDNFSLVMNASLIQSKVQFNNGSLFRDRPLEGQSPYILNIGIYYFNDDKGMMFSALYNVIGKRIAAVGRPSPNQWEDIPDIYEMPRNLVDLTFSKTIGKHLEIKGGVKDLLNQKVEYQQRINTSVDMSIYSNGAIEGMKKFDETQVTKLYNPGRYFTLGISFRL
jgi:TonB-dependent receptor